MIKRKILSLVMIVFFLLGVIGIYPNAVRASDEYAWVLVETDYRRTGTTDYVDSPIGEWQETDFYTWYINHSEQQIELKSTSPRGRTNQDSPQNMHVIYTWDAPAKVIKPGELISFSVNQEIISNNTGGYITHFSWNANIGVPWDMIIVEPTELKGVRSLSFGVSGDTSNYLQESGSVVFAREAWGKGRE